MNLIYLKVFSCLYLLSGICNVCLNGCWMRDCLGSASRALILKMLPRNEGSYQFLRFFTNSIQFLKMLQRYFQEVSEPYLLAESFHISVVRQRESLLDLRSHIQEPLSYWYKTLGTKKWEWPTENGSKMRILPSRIYNEIWPKKTTRSSSTLVGGLEIYPHFREASRRYSQENKQT